MQRTAATLRTHIHSPVHICTVPKLAERDRCSVFIITTEAVSCQPERQSEDRIMPLNGVQTVIIETATTQITGAQSNHSWLQLLDRQQSNASWCDTVQLRSLSLVHTHNCTPQTCQSFQWQWQLCFTSLLNNTPQQEAVTGKWCRPQNRQMSRYTTSKQIMSPPIISKKSQSQDGGLPELLLAYSCLTNHSEAALLWLVTPKQVVGDHQWRVVCCNAKYLNFGIQYLSPSNIKVIIQRPSCDYYYTGGFGFACE